LASEQELPAADLISISSDFFAMLAGIICEMDGDVLTVREIFCYIRI
jgi:hypothetical protein